MSDTTSALLTTLRNAVVQERAAVDVRTSKFARSILAAFQREGFIWDFADVAESAQPMLRVNLKYGPNGEHVIRAIKTVSSPGRRVYVSVDRITPVLQGIGCSFLSTNRGLLSDREAKSAGVGGEVICQVS